MSLKTLHFSDTLTEILVDMYLKLLFIIFTICSRYESGCRLWFVYADNSYLVYQHRDIKEIYQNLDKHFSNICDWIEQSFWWWQNKIHTIRHKT